MTSQPPADLIHLPVDQFLATLASEAPAPGGGSAAALAGALGAALAGMVARLTLGRPRYAGVQEQMAGWRDEADALVARLAGLVDADASAYLRVRDARRLPKDDAERQAQRADAIEEAVKGAVEIPLAVAAACVDVLEMLEDVARDGNRNAATDAAVAALLAHAGLQGAIRNVLVNLDNLRDATFSQDASARAGALLSQGQNALNAALAAAEAGA